MTDVSVRARLALLLVLLLASMAVAAGFALYQLRGVTLSISTVYADRVLPLLQLRAVAHAHVVTLPSVVQQVRDGQLDSTDALAELERARNEARQQWAVYKTTFLVPLEKTLIAQAEPLLARADAAHDKAAELLNKRDQEGLRHFANHEMQNVVRPLNVLFDQLVVLQAEEAATETDASHAACWRRLVGRAGDGGPGFGGGHSPGLGHGDALCARAPLFRRDRLAPGALLCGPVAHQPDDCAGARRADHV